MPKEIDRISDIVSLLLSGFKDWKSLGNIKVVEKGYLSLFSYTAEAQYEARWNFLERVSRGLIINNQTGEIVARPFDKFFNWGENGRYSKGYIAFVQEKADGSLAILFRDNGYKIATRGAFDSEQAITGMELLCNYNLEGLDEKWTLLFEVIYPENRESTPIVVDYGEDRKLVFLAARNRFTGGYASIQEYLQLADTHGFPIPEIHSNMSLTRLLESIESMDANREGFVVTFSDGERFKFKSYQYLTVQKIMMSSRHSDIAREMLVKDIDINSYPEKVRELIAERIREIEQKAEEILKEVFEQFNSLFTQMDSDLCIPGRETEKRKQFASLIQFYSSNIRYKDLLFLMYDRKSVKDEIMKRIASKKILIGE